MTTATNTSQKGLLVAADDLTVGRYYCVHSLKAALDEPLPVAGHSFKVVAINLPFFIGRLVSDPTQALTLDVRFLNVMRVTPDYVKAQAPSDVP
jgi:hypothetical protein